MTFLRELRNAAMKCSNVDYRMTLRAAADRLDMAIESFKLDVDEDAMRDLQGAWANAHRVLKALPPEGSPAPLAGSPEPAKLAAMAA